MSQRELQIPGETHDLLVQRFDTLGVGVELTHGYVEVEHHLAQAPGHSRAALEQGGRQGASHLFQSDTSGVSDEQ